MRFLYGFFFARLLTLYRSDDGLVNGPKLKLVTESTYQLLCARMCKMYMYREKERERDYKPTGMCYIRLKKCIFSAFNKF